METTPSRGISADGLILAAISLNPALHGGGLCCCHFVNVAAISALVITSAILPRM